MAAVTMLLFRRVQQTSRRQSHSPSFLTHTRSVEFLKKSPAAMKV